MKKMFFAVLVCFVTFGLAAQQIENTMIRINGGTFTMGSPSNETGHWRYEVQHQVTLSAFLMGKYEVTQKEYQEVMGYNPSVFKGDNLPVETVSWFDAVEYCNKRSEKEGLTPVYAITRRTPATGYPITAATVTANWNNNGYRLPTEAEWEYACRAGTTTAYNTGANITTSQANFNFSIEETSPVGSYAANRFGLHDMHGNVDEWCWNTIAVYPTTAQTNPRGNSERVDENASVIKRGGTWVDRDRNIRSARRDDIGPVYCEEYTGFRVVRNAQ